MQPPLVTFNLQEQRSASEFEESGGDGNNAEPSRTKDQGSKLGSSTAERSVCNASTINEADFDVEPLKSVDISHLATERTGEEQTRLKHLLWDIRDNNRFLLMRNSTASEEFSSSSLFLCFIGLGVL